MFSLPRLPLLFSHSFPHSHIFERQFGKMLKVTGNSMGHRILVKLFNIFVLQSSVCKIGEDNYTYLPGWLWSLNAFVYVKCLEESLAMESTTWTLAVIRITCHSPLKWFLSRKYIYFCCLISPFLWTLLKFFSPLLCLENSYSSFKTNPSCFLWSIWIDTPNSSSGLPYQPVHTCLSQHLKYWDIICLLVCLHKELSG